MSPVPSRIVTREIRSERFSVGGASPLLLIAGPDSLESEALALGIARELAGLRERLGIPVVFKASYDKANRSSPRSWRGPGAEEGLRLLERVRSASGLAVTTDVHGLEEVAPAARVVDLIQIPAFLCRQNDLLRRAGETGRVVNIKKGQFLAPDQIPGRIEAASAPACPGILITERGTTFGYHDLVNDLRAVPRIRALGTPVIFDATHSVQTPGGLGDRSGGARDLIPHLARAAAGAGVDGFFFEVHPDPEKALCDGPSSLRLEDLEPLLRELIAISKIVRSGAAAS